MQTLNTTNYEPQFNYAEISEKINHLNSNENFVFQCRQDPNYLYNELSAKLGSSFRWESAENGQEGWEVKITKIDSSTSIPTIGEMVAKNYKKAEVFKKFGIDFCCGGKKSVAEACKEQAINFKDVERALFQVDLEVALVPQNFDELGIENLIDYIVTTHHQYVINNIPILFDFINKVKEVHGHKFPETLIIAEKFQTIALELIDHMEKEEQVLFPRIKYLNNKEIIKEDLICGIALPIETMENEHENVGRIFKEIRKITNHYTPPNGACTTFKIAYKKLHEFEEDLHQHIHLENNILFKKCELL